MPLLLQIAHELSVPAVSSMLLSCAAWTVASVTGIMLFGTVSEGTIKRLSAFTAVGALILQVAVSLSPTFTSKVMTYIHEEKLAQATMCVIADEWAWAANGIGCHRPGCVRGRCCSTMPVAGIGQDVQIEWLTRGESTCADVRSQACHCFFFMLLI